MRNSLIKIIQLSPLLLVLVTSIFLLTRSDVVISGIYDQTRTFTRMIEFDYIDWTFDALFNKQKQSTLGGVDYLSAADQHDLVIQHTTLLASIRQLEGEINQVYANPNIPDPNQFTAALKVQLLGLEKQRDHQAPLVEAIIQQQVRQILNDFQLTTLGQEIPPVLFKVSAMPLALIVSPRDVIRQDVNLSLVADLSVEEKVDLESRVEEGLNVSSLVVAVGGVGIYPTMVMSTTDLNWLMEVVTHEWIHNYLTLRPLGVNYFTSGDLRTMNETTANLSGKELGQALINRFYPELAPEPVIVEPSGSTSPIAPETPAFDFRAEMRTTRVKVDEMLATGLVEEAEEYMEGRRQFFYDNGYQIRRLNQAYFAFYGAYADGGGGEAGEDPVGPAVVKLRESSTSLGEFLKKIGQMTSFAELQLAIENLP